MLSLSRTNLSILLFLNLFLFSCGYNFLDRPTYFSPHWKTIYIPPFKNYTQEPEIGEFLAYELRHIFAQGRLLIPVSSEAEADLVLKGEVLRVLLEPVSYEVFLVTRERKILFEGRFELIERKTGKKFYENPRLTLFETYRIREDLTGSLEIGKVEALRSLAKDLAELIFQEIFIR